jgi:AcrR family transcriptional regulator
MPKMVDHLTRRQELAEAVWRVIRRGGLPAATVRAVAAESGWSAGAVRHYFGSQADLLTFTMRLVADRVRARVTAVPVGDVPRRWAERVLFELLPLDADRAAENEVWLAFHAAARSHADMAAVREETYEAIRGLCRSVALALAPAGPADVLTRELNALLDGLALHAALFPDRWSASQLRRVLRDYLDRLAT